MKSTIPANFVPRSRRGPIADMAMANWEGRGRYALNSGLRPSS